MTHATKTASIKERAFICPHCGAYCSQEWFYAAAERVKAAGLPELWPSSDQFNELKQLVGMANGEAEEANAQWHLAEAMKVVAGQPRLGAKIVPRDVFPVRGMTFSRCFVCKDLGIWMRERLMFPDQTSTEIAHPDMPADVRADYLEATKVLAASPRSAAALLRLAVQKLCVHLGKPGKDINQDIASLVADGLDSRIQKALDALRVIGNEAVHPGTMDISDDTATAAELFKLLNFIVERMISLPRKLDAIYDGLPAAKLEGIAQRDAKAIAQRSPKAVSEGGSGINN